MNLLDPILTGFDQVVARTATAVPFFKIARTFQQVIDTSVVGFDNRIAWDTVIVDNDNLVDLATTPFTARILEPGLWQFELYLTGTPPATVGNTMVASISTGFLGQNFVSVGAQFRSGTNFLRVSHSVSISAAQIINNGGFDVGAAADFNGTIGTGIVLVESAELTGYWIGDPP
ncbi:MAG: hypothetical protein ACREIE_01430 [Nitrospiraceae bacterium]